MAQPFPAEAYERTTSFSALTVGAIKRIDAHTLEATTKKDGTVMVASRTVISHDGKTRTLTSKGNSSGSRRAIRATLRIAASKAKAARTLPIYGDMRRRFTGATTS